MITLLPVPGAPGYFIDTERYIPYSVKSGAIRQLAVRGKYKSVKFGNTDKVMAASVYRMAYAALNNIDITKIPHTYCISLDQHGELAVKTQKELQMERIKAREENSEAWEQQQQKIEMLNRYYTGRPAKLLQYVKMIEEKETWNLVWMYGMNKDNAELIVAEAVNRYIEDLKRKKANVYVWRTIRKYINSIRLRERRVMKRRSYEDWMQKITIEL